MDEQLQTLKVVITSGDSVVADIDLDGTTGLIGSGAHCDVRLSPEQVSVEQLRLVLKPAGLFVEVRSDDPKVYVEGAPFSGGRIKEGGHVDIGSLRIEGRAVAGVVSKKRELSSQINAKVIFGLVGIVGLFAFMVHRALRPAPEIGLLEPPAVFVDGELRCPETTPEAAAAAAEELLAKADGLKERAPFVPEDAVEAVRLYHQVAACLGLADWEHGASIIRQEAKDLEKNVEGALHVHNVRLWRALQLRRGEDAQNEIRVLRGYIKGQTGEYAEWLSTTERELDLALNKKAGG